jgi:hypothetical protein
MERRHSLGRARLAAEVIPRSGEDACRGVESDCNLCGIQMRNRSVRAYLRLLLIVHRGGIEIAHARFGVKSLSERFAIRTEAIGFG